ncbi:MAG: CAP domain-containing protein [Chloroflexota bacterium]|nr:CAP domain-containing protein [Chloroflexota bacterium]
MSKPFLRVCGPRILILIVLLGLPGVSQAQADAHQFPQTGHTVRGSFWTYWQGHGGLAQQGYPISEELREASDLNGQPYTVQYFERAVFERHLENAPPFDTLLSQLGTFRYRAKYPNGAPSQRVNADNPRLFAETGHTVGGTFRAYWEDHGGLAQQGYPISDEFTEKSDLNGQAYTVQYFERAVFERHPENAPPYNVLLSQLGRFRYDAKYANGGSQPTAVPTALGSTPTATRTPPSATPAAAALPTDWLARFNYYRAAAALPPVVADGALTAADALHIHYMLLNHDQTEHNETPDRPGYTTAGQAAAQGSNLFRASPGFTPADAIDGWMEEPLHRFGMLNPPLVRTGFALGCDALGCAAALNIIGGTTGPEQPDNVVYPGDGQLDAHTAAITWQFGPFTPPIMLVSATLTDAQGGTVPITTTPAAGYFNMVTLHPRSPLAMGAPYRADVTVTQDGTVRHKVWTFRTAVGP